MEVSDRLPSLPMNLLANAAVRTPIAFGTDEAAPDKSVKNLLAEFEVLRSAVIPPHGGRGSSTHYLAWRENFSVIGRALSASEKSPSFLSNMRAHLALYPCGRRNC